MNSVIIKEKQLSKIIKDNFHLKTIMLKLEGVVEGHISFISVVCQYKYKKGMLYIFDLINNVKINLTSQYKILFDENEKKLTIKLDNGQDLILTVIKIKDTP